MSKTPPNPNDQWLIKSANRVMGPFRLVEVIAGLQLKHFTVMDEIAAPFGRWVLVRDEQSLQAAVKDIRNRSDSIENTATMTHTLTSTMSMSMGESTSIEAPPPFPADLETRFLKEQQKLKLKIKKSNSSFVVTLIVFVAIALGGFLFFMSKRKSKVGTQEVASIAQDLWNQGLYDRSYALFTKAKTIEKENAEYSLKMSIYRIATSNITNKTQISTARTEITNNLEQFESKELLAEAYTAIGLSYLREVDLEDTIKGIELAKATEALSKALEAVPSFLPARINRGVLYFKSGNYAKAESEFSNLPDPSKVNLGLLHGLTILSTMAAKEKGDQVQNLETVLLSGLESYLQNNLAYFEELQILKALIYSRMDQKSKERDEALVNLLRGDLESGQNHRFDILVDRSLLSWKSILKSCIDITEDRPQEMKNLIFMAFCYSKAGDHNKAKQSIETAIGKDGKNYLNLAIEAFVESGLEMNERVDSNLSWAMNDKYLLNVLLLKAKINFPKRNEDEDKESKTVLESLLRLNTRSLAGIFEYARLENRRGNKKAALERINQGLSIDPTYLPLLELKNSL